LNDLLDEHPASATSLDGAQVVKTIAWSRKHLSRLRRYWEAGGNGLASSGDAIALELTAGGMLAMRGTPGCLNLVITQAGIATLEEELARERSRRRPHHDLAGRLAGWLRGKGRITWENIELPASVGDSVLCVRPDVYSLACTYNEKRINPSVYEVKVSRADFLSDLANVEKRLGYSTLSEYFFHAAPRGLIALDELPAECGLVEEVSEGDFLVSRRAPKRKCAMDAKLFMNLILKAGVVDER